MRSYFLVVAAAGLLAASAAAEEMEVVVTADKSSEPRQEVTQKVDVIDARRLDEESLQKGNLAEAFRYQPGTFVNVLSRNDANWGAYGGLGPKYDVYMLDGLPVDSFVDLMNIDPWALGGAEVQRGPAGTMYPNYLNMDFAGNQSPLTGITQLFLKDDVSSPLTRAELGYGMWNTKLGRFFNQGRKDGFQYFFGLSHEQSDYTDYGTEDSWLHMQDDPDYRKTKLYGRAKYEIEPGEESLSLFYNYSAHTGDAGRPNRGYEHDYDLLNAAYDNKLSDTWNLKARAGYRSYDRQWEEDNYPDLSLRETGSVKQNIIPLDFAAVYSGFGLLTFGTDMQFSEYETGTEVAGVRALSNEMDAASYGIYAQEKYVLGDWVMRGGLRYSMTQHDYSLISGVEPQDSDKSWNKLLWSAGLRYNATGQLALYSNVGTSYLVPSAKSAGGTLSADDLGVAGRNGQLPNGDLDPESGIGYDLGAEFAPVDSWQIGLRGFLNVVDDAIVENRVSNEPSQSMSVNAGQALSGGFELESSYRICSGASVFANYTLTRTNLDNDVDPDQDGSDVPFVPDYMLNAGAALRLPWELEFTPYLSLIGSYYDSSSLASRGSFGNYTIINARIRKVVASGSEYRARLGLDLNNILDRHYEQPWQFEDPGFSFLARLDLELW